jgi:hypothetical protein
VGLDHGFDAIYPDGRRVNIWDWRKNYNVSSLLNCFRAKLSEDEMERQSLYAHCVGFIEDVDDGIVITEQILDVMECVAAWLSDGDIFDHTKDEYVAIVNDARRHIQNGATVKYSESW